MKAICVHQFGGPEVLKLEEIEKPQAGPNQVVVRVHSAGVNPVETYQRSGANPSIRLPWTPGMDAAGVVETVGSGVAITQNEHDSTKWRLAEAVTLGLGESEQAFIVRDGQEPVPLGPSRERRGPHRLVRRRTRRPARRPPDESGRRHRCR